MGSLLNRSQINELKLIQLQDVLLVALLIAVVLWELASSLWKYWYFLLIIFFLDDIKDTISKLNSLVFKAKLPHLWSEAAIIKRVVYRNGNQHRKQFYFQGLKRVLSWLNWMYIWDKYFPFLQLSFVPQLNRTSFTFLYTFLFTDC